METTTKKAPDWWAAEFWLKQQWENILLSQVVSSLPNSLTVSVKGKMMQHSGKHAAVPTFLHHIAGFKFQMSICAFEKKQNEVILQFTAFDSFMYIFHSHCFCR